MIINKRFLIGQELVRRKLINQEQLDEALILHVEKGMHLGRALIEKGFIRETDLISVLADQFGIEFVDFDSLIIGRDVLSQLSGDVCRKYTTLPIKADNESITICLADPLNRGIVDKIQACVNKKIRLSIASERAIHEAVDRYYSK